MPAPKRRVCADCVREGISSIRKAPHPGPRCASHHRVKRSSTREAAWERRLMGLYGITADEYHAILSYQGGSCFICQRATGARRRLAVDHCHSSGYVRGCLCSPCNKMLGHLRDDIEAFKRAASYLGWPPAWQVIGQRVAPIEVSNSTPNG